jgi:transcriptional regulator with XRE-family HTH domain
MSRMGSEISRLRKEIGMTQKQLAKLVGATESFIIDVEAGRKILNSDLLNRISKALRQEVGRLDLFEGDEGVNKPEPDPKVVKVIEKPVQQVWNDALSGVLAAVNVYGYKMDKILETKQLPIIANKIDGYAKDKVFYLVIEDNDMIGFRMAKGDVAFACGAQQAEKDGIYLVEYNGKRSVRQVKKLDNEKLLLVSNGGRMVTETFAKKDVRVIARLIRLEIIL